MDQTIFESRNFSVFAKALGLPPATLELWGPDWETSQQSFAPEKLDFFQTEFVRTWSARLGMSPEAREALLAARAHLNAAAPVQRLAWHLYRRLYDSPGLLDARVPDWPMLPDGICPMSDLFYSFLFLAGLPRLRDWYAHRHIPESVLVETLADLELWMREHRRKTGRWGLSEHKWLIQHLAPRLFQLGRLQFQFGTYRYGNTAYRHTPSEKVVLFPEPGRKIAPDGFLAAADEEARGVTAYQDDGRTISGTPILPNGRFHPEIVALPRDEWNPCLSRGDAVLNIHIPGGSKMSHESCGESFRRAREFFTRYFPGFRWHAFACTSWLLDPQLADYLPESANLVRFLREFYLAPAGGNGRQIIERVFGGPIDDPEHAPRKTSLQRAVLEHLEKNKRWRSGAALLFPEDLDWDRQIYQRGLRAWFPAPGQARPR